jgi:hypothetical protein
LHSAKGEEAGAAYDDFLFLTTHAQYLSRQDREPGWYYL